MRAVLSPDTGRENRFVQPSGGIGQLSPAERARLVVLVREKQRRDLLRERAEAEGSLRAFTRAAWHVVEPAVPMQANWHLDCIAAHLEAVSRGELRRLLINVPPRHAKSLSVAVFWPMWSWATQPAHRWLFASYALSLSVRDSLKCRRLLESPWYRARWGDVVQLSGDQNQKLRFENSATGYRLATSVGGSNTGEGGDFVVVDDAHNVEEAESAVEREAVVTWWDEVMSTRVNDPRTVAFVVVGQRVHEADLSGHLLERGGYHHLCLPAEFEPRVVLDVGAAQATAVGRRATEPQPHDECPFYADPRTAAGELLWGARYGPVELADLKRDLGSTYGIAGQLQQRPVPRGGAVFNATWFRPLPSDFDEPREDGRTFRQRLRLVQFWDLGFSDRKGADYTVALTAGVDASRNVFLLHEWRERVHETALAIALAQHITATKPQLVGVEEGAYKHQTTRDLLRLLAQRPELQHACAVVPVVARGDKELRAQLPANRAQLGLLFADKTARWWPDFETELLRFPRGVHDDRVDALSGLVQLAVEGLPPPTPAEARRWAWQREDTKPARPWDPGPNERIDPETGRRQGYNPFTNQWQDLPDQEPAGTWR